MEDFTLEKIKDYKMFYILKNIKSTSRVIVLSHRQTHTNAVVEKDKYDLFKVGIDQVLVAFKSIYQHIGKHNYVASNGLEEENITLNPYERIADYYTSDRDDEESGIFTFLNSQPIVLEGQDWRCDNSLYGARIFYAIGQDEVPVFNGHAKIKVYEPILSINGIGYITYAKHGGDDTDIRFNFINDALLPQSGETLPEIIKLILEWSAVAVPPFENTEDIAVQAKHFVERFGITEELVAGQPDMQVAKFLQGDTSARLRTSGTYPMSEELNNLIINTVPYMTFSKLAQLHPDCFNLEQVVIAEAEFVREEWSSSLEKYGVLGNHEFGDVAGVYQYLTENMPDAADFLGLLFNLINKKKELLEGLA
jgi:hypothetical protein